MKFNVKEALQLLVKEGIRTYKLNNSKATLPQLQIAKKQDGANVKGAIFAVKDKADFTSNGVKGFIIGSREALLNDYNKLTHFTPNAFRTFGYADQAKKYVVGHEENNLLQINTFFIDIDTKKHSPQDIAIAGIDESVGAPTLIVETPSGYQAHWILKAPAFISNKNNFKLLKIAKRIAENLKRSMCSVDADVFCNSFAFCRVPNDKNVVLFNSTHLYTFKTFMDWSERYDDDLGRALFVVPSKPTYQDCLTSDWFHALLRATDIRGKKGQVGRNNALFTIALACMADGKDEQSTFDIVDEMNSNFKSPLRASEIRSLCSSAHSGRYSGPAKEYIEVLLASYVKGSTNINVSIGQKWYKHAKERAERTRSHLNEREADLIQYLENNQGTVKMTQKELCKAVGIASSSLNKLIKQSKKVVARHVGIGRNAYTIFMTSTAFIKDAMIQAMEAIQLNKQSFATALQAIVQQANIKTGTAGHKQVSKYVDALTIVPDDSYDLFTEVNTS